MRTTNRSHALARALIVMVLAGFLARHGLQRARTPAMAKARPPATANRVTPRQGRGSASTGGEVGGDLLYLALAHTAPQQPGESNHYFDLWTPGSLTVLARVNGLTNNHALMVDSHGKAEFSAQGWTYRLYTNEGIGPRKSKPSYYTARDLATVLGPGEAAGIHNILIAGCNTEGRFRSEDFRWWFPNATNVTHMAAGELSFKPMFYQAITVPSTEIHRLYGKIRTTAQGRIECDLTGRDETHAQPLAVYVADLFLPGSHKPYCTVQAGRERLEPAAASSIRPPCCPHNGHP